MQLLCKNCLNIAIRLAGLVFLLGLAFSPSPGLADDAFCQQECREMGYTDTAYTICAAPAEEGFNQLESRMYANNACRQLKFSIIDCEKDGRNGQCICSNITDTQTCDKEAGDTCDYWGTGRCEKSSGNPPSGLGCCINDLNVKGPSNCQPQVKEADCSKLFIFDDPQCQKNDISKRYCFEDPVAGPPTPSDPTDPSNPTGNPPSGGKSCSGKNPFNSQITSRGRCVAQEAACKDVVTADIEACSTGEKCCAEGVRQEMDIHGRPGSSNGGTCTDSPSEGWGPFSYKGSLVPCGRKCDDKQTTNREDKDCTICHMLLVVQNIFNLMKSLLFIVAIVMITVSGLIYVVSAGSSSIKTLAKGIITNTIKGFAIFMLSWLIVMTILSTLAYKSSVFNSNGLFSYTCDTTSAFEAGKEGGNVGVGGTGPGGTTPSTPGTPGSCNGISTTVSNQCSLASGELSSMLGCLKNSNTSPTVTSISAQNVGSDFNKAKNCCGDASCTHATQTCHYGCTVSGQQGYSHAVDVAISGKNEKEICEIAAAAQQCGAGQIWGPRNMCGDRIKYQEGHGSHLHISTRTCNH